MHPQKKFHLVSSRVMVAMMIFLMTLVITFIIYRAESIGVSPA